MKKFGIGQPVRRKEDIRFITGDGQYVDDISVENESHCVVLRSPMAHAVIKSIDTSAAAEMPGVLAVVTGKDFEAAGYGYLSCRIPFKDADDKPLATTEQWLLSRDRVRYVGEPVAFVVAETASIAQEAGEQIFVDYGPLEAVADVDDALAEGAPNLWESVPGNKSYRWAKGDEAATNEAFAEATHVVSVDLDQARVVPNPMETRGAIAFYDGGEDQYTLHVSCQGANNIQGGICSGLMPLKPEQLRVIAPDVGGAFGMKGFIFPEYIMVLHAAKLVGRPVRWIESRAEAFLCDLHGRDMKTKSEVALDEEGKILGLRVQTRANLGAYHSFYGPLIPTLAEGRWVASAYKVPAAYMECIGAVTNTAPVDAYRGAGRPEAAYVVECLMDEAARQIGMPADELRRRNFLKTAEMPASAWNGLEVHSCDFERNLDDALKAIDWQSVDGRKKTARDNGRLRGVGLAYYAETSASGVEGATIKFLETGGVQIVVGTQSNGQGHETSFCQVVSGKLGIDFNDIEFVQGDTNLVGRGGGTGGSRSLHMQGGALLETSDVVIGKGKKAAAQMLQSTADAIEFETQTGVGQFVVKDSQSAVTLKEVAAFCRDTNNFSDELKSDFESGLDSHAVYKAKGGGAIPNGCHICELEIDEDTGETLIVKYVVVDDFGVIVNPMIVEGQVQGGIAQGIGQALLEDCVYDSGTGQLMTGSFADYAMPRADDLCDFSFSYNEVPCRSNVLGVKGCGEAGTTGALPATVNAVVDALSEFGVTTIDLPATPSRIWTVIQDAKSNVR